MRFQKIPKQHMTPHSKFDTSSSHAATTSDLTRAPAFSHYSSACWMPKSCFNWPRHTGSRQCMKEYDWCCCWEQLGAQA